ncbi:mechanosensitive ion channel domain-containing protein [Leptolyngbya sp. AN03gr2]|uniref:mechanosensitive ion channel domain-containing protein n=1 Tax=unclassified Leptolyngbya TaxID=2650499 RepID=UPI003D32382F
MIDSIHFAILSEDASLPVLVNNFLGLFNFTLVQIGGIRLSFAALALLVLQIGCVLIFSRVVKQVIKKRILPGFGLELGTRESLSSLASYIISIAGVFLVIDSAGINLSSLTVFAGAIGLAIGIGLQNLANNFISGVILLLEQPIRVGDFVEVGAILGTVERISLRSTMIRTGNGLTVFVPNSSLANNSLINWTHQDPTCCISIQIAVADTNDSMLVTEALLAAAHEEPNIVASPKPLVFFRGIDNGAFQFEMEFWITQPRRRSSIKSALLFLVQAKFRDYGITYASNRMMISVENARQISASIPVEELATNQKITRSTAITLKELLRKVSYFANLSDIELRHIIEEGYQKKLPSGEVICRENDPGDSFYIILSGSVDVIVESIGKHVAVREAGEFIGEMSLLMGTPRTATLQTLEETMLFVVDRGNLQSLLRRHQELADRISEELVQRQDTLERLGIKVGSQEEPPLIQIRNRIRSIFGI